MNAAHIARRVLVVDDNRDAATTLAMLLELAGHSTRVAHDGQRALATAEVFEADVGVLDIGMPGMSGLDLARRLRASPEHRGTVLIALTGWGQPADRRATALAGFDRHLVKPVNPDELLRVIDDLTAQRDGAHAH